MNTPLLRIESLQAAYGHATAIRGANLEIGEGELRVILGANGAGKTTIIRSVVGLLNASGRIDYRGGQNLLGLKPHLIHRLGIACVPEGRQLWQSLSVLDNLRMGAFAVGDRRAAAERVDAVMDRFPRLRERRDQLAGSLSGGEQQMVALARALVSRPQLLLLDEPSLGLAPLVVKDVFRLIKEINREGVAVLMVEQNAQQALKIADWAYLLEVGSIVASGPPAEMVRNDSVREAFLGGRH